SNHVTAGVSASARKPAPSSSCSTVRTVQSSHRSRTNAVPTARSRSSGRVETGTPGWAGGPVTPETLGDGPGVPWSRPDTRPRAVITGGSSGIGLALAHRLATRQWRLALVARGEERLHAAAASLPVETSAHVCDVGDPDAVAALAADLLELGGGRVDLLVCNAGIPGRSGALDVDPAVARSVMDVNYHGMVGLTRALWPALVAARGGVVNVCSVAGTVALARSAPYSASKHAALAWSRALAAAAPAAGVRVLTVNPGPVPTPGFPQADLLAHRLGRRF